MYKNLVKRSKFLKLLVAINAPVHQLIEGDEVYIYGYPAESGNSADFVYVERETERGWKTMFPDSIQDEILPSIPTTGTRTDLSGRSSAPHSQIVVNGFGETGINLLAGFSDLVKFSIEPGSSGGDVAVVIVEIITYEKRK